MYPGVVAESEVPVPGYNTRQECSEVVGDQTLRCIGPDHVALVSNAEVAPRWMRSASKYTFVGRMSRGRLQGGRAMADSRSRYTLRRGRDTRPFSSRTVAAGASIDRPSAAANANPCVIPGRPKNATVSGASRTQNGCTANWRTIRLRCDGPHAGGLALKNSVLTGAVEAWRGGVQNGNSLRCKALLGPRVTASPGPAPGHIDRLASAAMDLANFGNARHLRW